MGLGKYRKKTFGRLLPRLVPGPLYPLGSGVAPGQLASRIIKLLLGSDATKVPSVSLITSEEPIEFRSLPHSLRMHYIGHSGDKVCFVEDGPRVDINE